MAVNAKALETPERGMELETREESAGRKGGAAAELKALRDKIEELRARPVPEAPKVDTYSRDWFKMGFEKGWKAVLDALEKD